MPKIALAAVVSSGAVTVTTYVPARRACGNANDLVVWLPSKSQVVFHAYRCGPATEIAYVPVSPPVKSTLTGPAYPGEWLTPSAGLVIVTGAAAPAEPVPTTVIARTRSATTLPARFRDERMRGPPS